MKKHDHTLTESYEFTSQNFERFLHDAMLAQNNKIHFDKLFRAAEYAYDDI